MSVSKNWEAEAIAGIAGNEIIVRGEANVGMLDVMPALEKRIPQGINPTILQLDLLNAGDASPENFQPVQYNEKIPKLDTYRSVDIFHDSKIIQRITVSLSTAGKSKSPVN